MSPAVSSEEERGLLYQTAAGNRAYVSSEEAYGKCDKKRGGVEEGGGGGKQAQNKGNKKAA